MTPTPIPPDFPRGAPEGAVPGAQPKVLARDEGGLFIAGSGERDVQARYVMCEDLAHQLVTYSARKRAENPGRSEAQLLDKVAQAVRKKAFGWGLSATETEWVLGRLGTLTLVADRKANK